MALDLTNLSPTDVTVTMRSIPRRFTEALEVGSGEDRDELAGAVGPDGHSALDHLADTGRVLSMFAKGLADVLSGHRPVLHAALTDAAARPWDQAPSDLDGELGLLADAAEEVAAQVQHAPSDRWQQVGQVAGGEEITALDLAKQAVRVAIDGLRATEAAMAAARR
jgi:hypothetical protein